MIKAAQRYAILENCNQIEPLKLNPEIKTSLLDSLIKKDKKIIEKQHKVAMCLLIDL